MRVMSRNPLMDKIGAFIIGIIAIIAGIWIILDNNKSFNEYENSTDKKAVVAEIIDVHVRTETRRSGGRYSSRRKVKKYDCTLEYTINDNRIQNKKTYSIEKKVGDKITLNVYKDKYGDYKIAKITSKSQKNTSNGFAYAVILIGVCAIVYGAVTKVDNSVS